MTNQFNPPSGLALSLAVALSFAVGLALIGVAVAAEDEDETGSTTCSWGSDAATGLTLCQSAWDQSAANTSCSNATVTADQTACLCRVEATCTKDDGVTTNSASLSDPSPDDFNGAINCDGELKIWNC